MAADTLIGVLILDALLLNALGGRIGYRFRTEYRYCQVDWKQDEFYNTDLCTRCKCWSKELNSAECTIEDCGTLTCEQKGTEIYQPPHKCCPDCVPVRIR
ncbi:hypothetical protein Bpfe_007314 [Biomphalaria pfeifferi]|uniref:VWFC domain-containing protein n=1 Tax=Biomphalaria pfeifferi TaxID=112525 RepID=A0AAD8BYR1_BIOPF|nr:hypothetical protein Bpfe_007314 [Biomphalaria pfeifferi]